MSPGHPRRLAAAVPCQAVICLVRPAAPACALAFDVEATCPAGRLSAVMVHLVPRWLANAHMYALYLFVAHWHASPFAPFPPPHADCILLHLCSFVLISFLPFSRLMAPRLPFASVAPFAALHILIQACMPDVTYDVTNDEPSTQTRPCANVTCQNAAHGRPAAGDLGPDGCARFAHHQPPAAESATCRPSNRRAYACP